MTQNRPLFSLILSEFGSLTAYTIISEKFSPEFSKNYFISLVYETDESSLPLPKEQLLSIIQPVIFNPDILPKRVNKADGEDLVATSACNYYEGLVQAEVENFPHAHPLNSTLCKKDGVITEDVWRIGGKYGKTIETTTKATKKITR